MLFNITNRKKVYMEESTLSVFDGLLLYAQEKTWEHLLMWSRKVHWNIWEDVIGRGLVKECETELMYSVMKVELTETDPGMLVRYTQKIIATALFKYHREMVNTVFINSPQKSAITYNTESISDDAAFVASSASTNQLQWMNRFYDLLKGCGATPEGIQIVKRDIESVGVLLGMKPYKKKNEMRNIHIMRMVLANLNENISPLFLFSTPEELELHLDDMQLFNTGRPKIYIKGQLISGLSLNKLKQHLITTTENKNENYQKAKAREGVNQQ